MYIEIDKSPRDDRYSFDELINHLKQYYNMIKTFNYDSSYPLLYCTDYKN